MQKVLYRERRPEILDEVLGQEHIVRILKNQIESNTIAHAYLLSGIRGTGKTTVARLIAKAVNCTSEETKPCGVCQNCIDISAGNFVDVIEIDAASNGGIDNIRQIKENANLIPMVAAKKVYIIDEAHMISKDAANAFLKVLEEPPEHVHFILATTDPQALIVTILSRCMRLDFRRISDKVITENICKICNEKGITIHDEAAAIITSNADGSARDSLSLLQQCISSGIKIITPEYVLTILGGLQISNYIDMTNAIINSDVARLLMMLDNYSFEGKDVRQIMRDWLTHYRNLLISKYSDKPEAILSTTQENIERIKKQSEDVSLIEIKNGIEVLVKAINDAKHTNSPKIILEMAIIRLAMEKSSEAQSTKSIKSQQSMSSITQKQIQEQTQKRFQNKENSTLGSITSEPGTSDTRTADSITADPDNSDARDTVLGDTDSFDIEHDTTLPDKGKDKKTTEEQNQNNTEQNSNQSEENIVLEDDSVQNIDTSILNYDLESIWNKIILEAKKEVPMLAVLGPTTKLISLDDKNFTITCTSVSVGIIDDYSTLFEKLIKKHTGKSLRLKTMQGGK